MVYYKWYKVEKQSLRHARACHLPLHKAGEIMTKLYHRTNKNKR